MPESPDQSSPISGQSEDSLHLVLMRHAKSDWSGEDVADHDRPLNSRGVRDAPVMARWIAETGFVPNYILCSSAKRTQQTAALMESYWKHTNVPTPRLVIEPPLYLASAKTILQTVERVSRIADEDGENFPRTVLILGHNPGISHAASMLAGHPIGLPTAAMVVYRCSTTDWSDTLGHENAMMVDQMKPKLLGREHR